MTMGRISMASVCVRYIVDDIDEAISFYSQQLGFIEEKRPTPILAVLSRGDLRVILSATGGPPAIPGGPIPKPGGWNRFKLEVSDLEALGAKLRGSGAHCSDVVLVGDHVAGGKQIMLEDPSGNLIELFEPVLAETSVRT